MRKHETAVCGTACTVVWEVGKCENRRQMPFMISIYLLPDYLSPSRGRTCPTHISSFSSANLPPTSPWRKSKHYACVIGQTFSCVAVCTAAFTSSNTTSSKPRRPCASSSVPSPPLTSLNHSYIRLYQRISAIEFSILRIGEYPIPSIIDIVNSIRLAKGNVFAEWKNSDTAKLFEDHG